MELEKILAVSGKPGLYELKAQTRNGFIGQSLLDGKKRAMTIQNNVSMLSEISIYTYSDETPLPEVFEKIREKEDGKKAIDHKKSAAELSQYLREVLPEYDEERVYDRDIKKLFQWYNLLIDHGMTSFEVKAKDADPDTEPPESGTDEKEGSSEEE